MKQIIQLHKEFDALQNKYGDPSLYSIYGAGNIDRPKVMFIFMNPTGKNIASNKEWNGLRAPWLGNKNVWNIFNELALLDNNLYESILHFKPSEWNVDFANQVYSSIEKHSVYVTNLAKCTQIDARPLSNIVFKEYLDLMYKEIEEVGPSKIVTFGNQVSSILLKRNIKVSNYNGIDHEILNIDNEFNVFPTYYPVGQGRRNMPLAIARIRQILLG